MDRLLSSRTPGFLTQMNEVGEKSTVLNAFATEVDCLQVRPNTIHCVLLLFSFNLLQHNHCSTAFKHFVGTLASKVLSASKLT